MKTNKISLKRVGLLLVGVMALCSLTGLAYYELKDTPLSAIHSWLWKTDPVVAGETAQDLIDYDLPPGYQPEKVLRFWGKAVIIASQDHPSDLIYISQAPNGILTEEEWQTVYGERRANRIGDQIYDTEIINTQTAMIRGQPTILQLLEGNDKEGQAVKQLACVFKGKISAILLVIVASQDTWDQAMMDHFLNSIR